VTVQETNCSLYPARFETIISFISWHMSEHIRHYDKQKIISLVERDERKGNFTGKIFFALPYFMVTRFVFTKTSSSLSITTGNTDKYVLK
jgi:hypothetical protein